MKQSLFFSLLFLIFSFSITAQSVNIARATKAAERMAGQLDLSEEQQDGVRDAYLKMYTQLSNLEDEFRGDSATKKKKENIRTEFNNSIAGILTPEQQQKWATPPTESEKPTQRNKKRSLEHSPEQQQQNIERSATHKTDRLAKQLDLTDDQYKKIYDAQVDKQTKMYALRNLPKEERRAIPTKRKEINAEYHAIVDQVLTKEQKEKREAIEEDRMNKRKEIKKNRHHSKTSKVATYVNKMTNSLGLTIDQNKAVEEAYTERMNAMDKTKEIPVADRKEARQTVVDQYNEKLKNILTANQWQKHQESQLKN